MRRERKYEESEIERWWEGDRERERRERGRKGRKRERGERGRWRERDKQVDTSNIGVY